MRSKACVTAALILFSVSLSTLHSGCGGGGEKRISEISLSNPAQQDSFALYYPVAASTSPCVPSYTVGPNLSGVAGAQAAGLPAAVSRTLASQGFVAVAGAGATMYQAYQDISGPKFVTIDAIMHTCDSLCAYVLGDVEGRYLAADLSGLIAALFETTLHMYDGCGGTAREAVLANLSYLGVAARLLGVDVDLPSELETMVSEEIALITAASGSSPSPVFGYARDYGLYAPRGHYRTGSGLEEYYRAMTWLGGMGFYPSPGTAPGDVEAGRGMTRQALLLLGALHMAEVGGEPAFAVWDRIYQPASFLSSCVADLNAYDYTRLARELMGDSIPLSRLCDDILMDEFIARALAEQAPRIATLGGENVTLDDSSISFRLFAQSANADDYVFEQLVAPQVAERFMPRGLDLPAALGSDRALEILEQFYGEKGFEGYEEQMNGLRKLLKNVDPIQIHSNLYWSRLDVLRLLLKPYGEGYPAFMTAPAWQDRCLYAFLGSWVEIRHNSDDYTGQECAELPQPQPGAQEGFVEPCPEAFARLAAMADVIRRGLGERGLASQAVEERLNALYELLVRLKTMAEKELRAEALSAEEYATIAGIGDVMRYLVTFPVEEGGGEACGADASLPLTGTVYTDATYGEMLQAAVGKPVLYYVIAPVGGRPTLTTGAGFSYYEFVRPADSPATDETWREMLESGQAPERPAWSLSFLQ